MNKCAPNCSCQDNCYSDKIKESDIIKIINRVNKICKFCKPCEVLSVCVSPNKQSTIYPNEVYWFNFNTQKWNVNLTWKKGNGDGVIIVGAKLPLLAPFASPQNNTTYTPDYNFGDGEQIGFQQYVVYNGSGTNATITGLDSSQLYLFIIFDYNSSEFCYNTTGSSYVVNTPPPPM